MDMTFSCHIVAAFGVVLGLVLVSSVATRCSKRFPFSAIGLLKEKKGRVSFLHVTSRCTNIPPPADVVQTQTESPKRSAIEPAKVLGAADRVQAGGWHLARPHHPRRHRAR